MLELTPIATLITGAGSFLIEAGKLGNDDIYCVSLESAPEAMHWLKEQDGQWNFVGGVGEPFRSWKDPIVAALLAGLAQRN